MVADENGVRPSAAELEKSVEFLKRQGYFRRAKVIVGQPETIAPPQENLDTQQTSSETTDQLAEIEAFDRAEKHPVLGLSAADQSAAWVGGTAKEIAGAIENHPWLKYSLIGLDVAAGPAMFAVREGFSASPAGQWVQAQQANAIGRVADEYVAKPGYNATDSTDAAVGIFTVGMLAIGGAWAWAKATSGLGRKLDSLEARLRREEQNVNLDSEAGYPGPLRITRAHQLADGLNETYRRTGRIDPKLLRQLTEESTHELRLPDGSLPKQVTLGPSNYGGSKTFYRDKARENGGYWFGMDDDVFDKLGHGLSKQDAFDLQWSVNKQFVDNMVERGMSFRFEGFNRQQIQAYGKGFTFNEMTTLNNYVASGKLVWNGSAYVPRGP
jgi:hypothetical protein